MVLQRRLRLPNFLVQVLAMSIFDKDRQMAPASNPTEGRAAENVHLAEIEALDDRDRFAQIVSLNRTMGIDPGRPERDGPVVYAHSDIVPMSGDTFWAAGRTISSAVIARRFKRLKI